MSKEKLFRLFCVLSLPAYLVFFSTLALLPTERFVFRSGNPIVHSDVVYYVVIGFVYFAVFGWFGCIATNLGMLTCYVLLLKRTDVTPAIRRWASFIALCGTVAWAVLVKIIPTIIPAP